MNKILTGVMVMVAALAVLPSCTDSESYANLLKAEEKATNWYMAQRKICLTIPADSVFEVGEDAPYYKMDEDGYLYMQVIRDGGRGDNLPKKDEKVLFRYQRMNIKNLYLYDSETWEGNIDNLEYASTSFYFNNYYLESSQAYGKGIQIPVSYLGYDSEVNIVLRSYLGFSSDMATCQPYAMKIKYYKPVY